RAMLAEAPAGGRGAAGEELVREVDDDANLALAFGRLGEFDAEQLGVRGDVRHALGESRRRADELGLEREGRADKRLGAGFWLRLRVDRPGAVEQLGAAGEDFGLALGGDALQEVARERGAP